MKKRIGTIFAFFLFCNIYGIKYKTLESAKLYESDGTFDYYARDIDKDETVKISKVGIYHGVSDWKYSVEILYQDNNYFINVENLMPEDTQSVLSDDISLIHCEDVKWFPAYCFDMLKEQDRDVIKSKQQNGFRNYQNNKTEFDYEWYDTLSNLNPSYFFNPVITVSLLFDNSSFLVKSIRKELSDYSIEAEVYDWFMPDATRSYSEGDAVLLKVSMDGDYLSLFCDGQLLGQFVRTNNETKTEIESLIRNNTCDLSKVTWPRHADGSSDFDDRIEPPSIHLSENNKAGNATAGASEKAENASAEAATPKPAPALGKTATVTENLRLRTDDTATAEVVTTLAAGTRVKVLAPGREDTIDGIASSWAQVKVLGDAKDKDGNAIAADTTGWLFGGYLAEAEEATLPESAESERPETEAADAKEASAPPIVPIAAGIAALAVLLGVALLAAKRKKGGKE